MQSETNASSCKVIVPSRTSDTPFKLEADGLKSRKVPPLDDEVSMGSWSISHV